MLPCLAYIPTFHACSSTSCFYRIGSSPSVECTRFVLQVRHNEAVLAEKMADNSEPMSYYRAFKDVISVIPKDAVIVSDGLI